MFLLIVTPKVDLIQNNTSPANLVKWITKISEEYEFNGMVDVEHLHQEGFEDIPKDELIMDDHLVYEMADEKILFISEEGHTMNIKDFLKRAKELLPVG